MMHGREKSDPDEQSGLGHRGAGGAKGGGREERGSAKHAPDTVSNDRPYRDSDRAEDFCLAPQTRHLRVNEYTRARAFDRSPGGLSAGQAIASPVSDASRVAVFAVSRDR
jgi:hypothetical protein